MGDLLTGATILLAGLVVWWRRRELAGGPLLVAAGTAWFAGDLWYLALFWHRGVLLHALLTPRGWRPARRRDALAIAVGYAAALIVPVGQSAAATIALGLGVSLVAASVRDRDRLPAAGFGAVLGAVGLARSAGVGADALLLVYEAGVCAVAIALAVLVSARPWERVTDLVVELASAPSGSVRDALARALGDPSLQIGYASPDGFRDGDGRVLGPPAEGRAQTLVERDGVPVAALVHDAGLLDDPRLVDTLSAAAQLAAANARLQAEVREQMAELQASRARLLAVADEERAELQRRLHDGAERRLARIGALLEGTEAEQAATVLAAARADLRTLAQGLAPDDLAGALGALAGASAVPVELRVVAEGIDRETSAVAYFVCAEALANASKHAAAQRVTVDVHLRADGLAVEVADDGRGGADPRGSGLNGLSERVAARGGRLSVDSPPGRGTRIAARLPLT